MADTDDDKELDSLFSSDRDRVGKGAPAAEDDPPQPETAAKDDGGLATDDPAPETADKAEDDPDPASPGRDPRTGKFVPVGEFLAERKKLKERADTESRLRQEAEARAAQYEQQMAAFMRQQQTVQQQPEAPDPVLDPEGAFRYHQQMMSEQVMSARLDASEYAARARYGDDIIDKALDVALRTGANRHFMQARDPYGEMIKWFKRNEAMREVGDDPSAYRKRIEEETRTRLLAELKTGKLQQPSTPQRLPGTLADATASGAQGAHLSEEAAFGSIFSSDRRSRQAASGR